MTTARSILSMLLILMAALIVATTVTVTATVAVANDSAAGATATEAASAPNDVCAGVPRYTLLASCPPCANGAACIVYDHDPTTSKLTGCDFDTGSSDAYCVNAGATCEFQCFTKLRDASVFAFLVPYKATLPVARPRRPVPSHSIVTTTENTPFQSNVFVNAIGKLDVASSVTSISIYGGRQELATKGRVVNLSVDPVAFAAAPQLRSVALLNMDLSSGVASALESMPTTLTSLDLRNTRLSKLPDGALNAFAQLQTLSLGANVLSAVSLALPNLNSLDLSDNKLVNFTAVTPQLHSLDLSGNNLIAIPPSVFAMPNLRVLNLGKNPIATPLVLTPDQVTYLKTLQEVTIDVNSAPNTSGGNGASTATIGAGTIPVIIAKPGDKVPTPTPTAITPKTSFEGGMETGSGSSGSASNKTSHIPTVGDTIDAIRANGTTVPQQTPRTSDNIASNKSSDGAASTLLIVLIVVGVIVLTIASAFLLLWRKRRNAAKYNAALYFGPDSYTKMGSEANASGSSVSKSILLGELPSWADGELLAYRLRVDDIRDARIVGSGSRAVVWLVSYRGGAHQFASKRLIDNGNLTTDHMNQFAAEIKLAASLSHPSIVQFFGVAWTNEADLQALFEFMPNGDLRSYLGKTKPSADDWMPDKLRLALDIVEALVYTHSFDPPLVHRDLKSRNVLLDEDFKAKLGDFGCARFGSENDTMTADGVGTGRWLAPEMLSGSTHFDESSDIYSFGVLLTELDTHLVPYTDVVDRNGNGLSETAILQRVAHGDLQPSLSSACPLAVRQIARACLSFHATHRPTAINVAYKLRQALNPSSA